MALPICSMMKCLLPVLLFAFSFFFLSSWWREYKAPVPIYPYPYVNTRSNNTDLHDTDNVTILLWHWPFGQSQRLDGDVCWDRYHISNCRLVDQRSLFPIADLVVFHNRELVQGTQKLPLNLPRPQGQRWVWFTMESPVHNGNLKPFPNIFNLTMTYRRDADITASYGELLPKGPGNEEHGGERGADDKAEDAVPQNKSIPVCWVVSNYNPQHRRSKVFKELNDVIPVKVYGQWTRRPLASNALLHTISRCYFYLAFENSIFKDYITEKLWSNSYKAGAVPVVLGPPLDDYKAVAPCNSFLHVDEFASLKDLGKRLKELVEDQESYAGYMAWRQNWKVKMYTSWAERLCGICPRYNSLPREKVYKDLDGWEWGRQQTGSRPGSSSYCDDE